MKVHHCLIVCFCVVVVMVTVAGCADDRLYRQEIETWRTERIVKLKEPRGWLSLTGLYPIRHGLNTVGFGDTHDIRFPGNGELLLATITLDSAGLQWSTRDTGVVTEEGRPYTGGQIPGQEAPVLNRAALYWTFIERGGQYYLRLWDTTSVARQNLHGLPHFPVDLRWRLPASFTPADSGTMVALDDIFGQKRRYPVAGYIHAAKDGNAFTLTALEGGEDALFLIIEDATTDVSTYPAGRYLYIPMPEPDGTAELDFNKAYNPPCAFTEFATCLLAPPENRLSFAITAGEKTVGH